MKKIFIVLCLFFIHSAVKSSTVVPGNETSQEVRTVMIPLMGTDKMISVEDFLHRTPASYRDFTGQRMNLGQRLDLRISKHSLKKLIHKDGTVHLEKMKRRGFFGGWQWHWGGFALGFFLSLLGPIVALFFNDDYKWDRFWTALHTAVWVALLVTAFVAL